MYPTDLCGVMRAAAPYDCRHSRTGHLASNAPASMLCYNRVDASELNITAFIAAMAGATPIARTDDGSSARIAFPRAFPTLQRFSPWNIFADGAQRFPDELQRNSVEIIASVGGPDGATALDGKGWRISGTVGDTPESALTHSAAEA